MEKTFKEKLIEMISLCLSEHGFLPGELLISGKSLPVLESLAAYHPDYEFHQRRSLFIDKNEFWDTLWEPVKVGEVDFRDYRLSIICSRPIKQGEFILKSRAELVPFEWNQ